MAHYASYFGSVEWGVGLDQAFSHRSNEQQQQQISNNNVKTDLAFLSDSYAAMRSAQCGSQIITSSNTSPISLDVPSLSLADIMDPSFLSGLDSTSLEMTSDGINPDLLASFNPYLSTDWSSEQPQTVVPSQLWRSSSPTYVQPSSFDLASNALAAALPGNDLAAGNHDAPVNHIPVQSAAEPTPASPIGSDNSAAGSPSDESSTSPVPDVAIKTEPDLELEDGRAIRSLPTRASKSRRRIPLDAPIQPRNYNGPSRTAAKPLPKGFEKALSIAQAAGVKRKLEADDEEDDEETTELVRTIKDKVALKRAKNTLAARKSRARKAAYTEELERSISEREERIAELERTIQERDVEIRVLKSLRYAEDA